MLDVKIWSFPDGRMLKRINGKYYIGKKKEDISWEDYVEGTIGLWETYAELGRPEVLLEQQPEEKGEPDV